MSEARSHSGSLDDFLAYVCVSQSEPRVSLWLRDEGGRLTQREDIVDMQAPLAIGHWPEGLRLADIYEDTGLSEPSPSAAGG